MASGCLIQVNLLLFTIWDHNILNTKSNPRRHLGNFCVVSFSVSKGGRLVQKNVGYCPQFDALFHELTPTEHLQLYAKIRGITTSAQKRVINSAYQKEWSILLQIQ